MATNWKMWKEHFEGQKDRPEPVLLPPHIPEDWRVALIHSLARFQLGESGEGRIAHEIDDAQDRLIDADYRAALKLFVKEEGRHARILAEMIRTLDGSLLKETWTNRLFTWSRRLMGLNLKLLVLLAAEIIGLGFYRLVKDRLPAGSFRTSLKEIIDDESFHLLFHSEYFRRWLTSAWMKGVFLFVWWTVSLAACTVVYFDHRVSWRTFRVPFFPSARRLLGLIHDTSLAILGREPLAPTAAQALAFVQ